MIFDGAVGLARESGLESLTVRAVAQRVGVTPALVAHYRPVMDAFLAEVFGEIVGAEREEVMAEFGQERAVRDDLFRMVETLLDGSRDDVTLVWVQAWALGVRNETLAARVRTEMDLWQSAIEEHLSRAVAAGEIAASRTDTAAWMLLAMIDGMNAHSLVKWAPHDRADLARRVLSVALDHPDDPAPSPGVSSLGLPSPGLPSPGLPSPGAPERASLSSRQ